MDCCIVCLQPSYHPFARIIKHSSEWNREQIEQVVMKHLWWWYPKSQAESQDQIWICKHCWQEISSFHNFYLKVEVVHRQYETLLFNNISNPKSMEFNTSKHNEDQVFGKSKSVNLTSDSIEEVKACSSESLFNDEACKKQIIESECSNEEEENSKVMLISPYVINEPIKDDFQTNNNSHIIQVKDELQCDSFNDDDNVNSVGSSIEETYNVDPDIDDCTDKLSNLDEETRSSESPEHRANLGKLKNNDIIEFDLNLDFEFNLNFEREFNFKLECIICKLIASTFARLCFHYRHQHNIRGFAVCCGIKFFRRHLLIDHLCVHKDPNFFKCHRCHRVYSGRPHLKIHLRKNRCTPKFECNQCGKQFLIRKCLKRHKLTHLTLNEEDNVSKACNKIIDSESLQKNHTESCDNCVVERGKQKNFKASNESDMEDIQEHDKNEFEKDIKNASCSITDRENKTSRVKAFKNMYKTSVSDDFFQKMQYKMDCRICKMTLPNFRSLITHFRIEHNQVGYGMCCGKKYYRPCALADHLKLHKDPDLFKCSFCDRKLGSRSGFERHIENCFERCEGN